ncbi:MAG: hypothetical protein FWD23_05755 [Oscillospiraceae bacterium]|nr:hypothetical protein [Oscillospiraceae bacterium]
MDYERYYEKAQKLKVEDFKQIIGVKKETFVEMEKVLLEDESIEVILVDVMECPNVNAKIKVFKIMANKYRNRRKRHALRANLICGIMNFDARTYFPRKCN